MATYNRRKLFSQALRNFSNQAFTNSELIVIDDGTETVEDLCRDIDRVLYIRLPERTSVGRKLNIGIEVARGVLVQKLDDDDYYGPSFHDTVTNIFLSGSADYKTSVVAWDCFLVLMRGSSAVRYSGHGWAAGGTLCFARQIPGSPRFREDCPDEDAFFLRDHGLQLVRVCDPESYMLVRHGSNTWQREDEPVDVRLSRLPIYPKRLESVVGSGNHAFYHSIAEGAGQAGSV